ncbi:MAG: glucose 1-dehydrogenase [Pseudomonadota bacterium]|nr:glucose 1-dehydrogenase [Pseudomonadota bacterium]
MARFDGRTVLITGANSGIGAASARAFGAEGARLMLTGNDGEEGAAVAADINDAGGDAQFIQGDLMDRGFREGLVDCTVAELGRLDVLFNNAGVGHGGTVEDMPMADYQLVMTVNLEAPFALCRAAIPVMKAQGGGVIVNTASELGTVATKRAVAYCASKGGVILMTRAMALDHARDGIRINAICPGPVDTALLYDGNDDPVAGETPMNRIGEVGEIAPAVLFLASDDASFMTGATMIVDGGATA